MSFQMRIGLGHFSTPDPIAASMTRAARATPVDGSCGAFPRVRHRARALLSRRRFVGRPKSQGRGLPSARHSIRRYQCAGAGAAEPSRCGRDIGRGDVAALRQSDLRAGVRVDIRAATGTVLALGLPILGDPQIAQSQVTTFSSYLLAKLARHHLGVISSAVFFKTHADLLRRGRSRHVVAYTSP